VYAVAEAAPGGDEPAADHHAGGEGDLDGRQTPVVRAKGARHLQRREEGDRGRHHHERETHQDKEHQIAVASDIDKAGFQVREITAGLLCLGLLVDGNGNEQQHRDGDSRRQDVDHQDDRQGGEGQERRAYHGGDEHHRRLYARVDAGNPGEMLLRHDLRQHRADGRAVRRRAQRPHRHEGKDEPELTVPQERQECQQRRGQGDHAVGQHDEPLAWVSVSPDARKGRQEKHRQKSAEYGDRHHGPRLRLERHVPHERILHQGRTEQGDHLPREEQGDRLLPGLHVHLRET